MSPAIREIHEIFKKNQNKDKVFVSFLGLGREEC
jgi:hypothetical protein